MQLAATAAGFIPPPPAPNEAERLAALRSYDVLDTACEESFDGVAELARRLLNVPTALVTLLDADRQWFKARAGFEATEGPRDTSFCGHAILEPAGATMVVPDATKDPRFAGNPFVTGETRLRFYAGVPLVNAEGHALGTLCVLDHEPRELSDADNATLRALARMVVTTLELRRASLNMRSMATSDSLTALPNRVGFLASLDRAIQRARRDGEVFSLLMLDLDGFKAVNDRFGHAEGDAVLRAVGAQLAATLRREDEPSRLGGDEFAAVLWRIDLRDARDIAERVRQAIASRMEQAGWAVTASIGTVTFHTPPASAEDAIRRADALMYEAKRAGRDRAAHAVVEADEPT
ncbi:sensor domain-containing diguanylate cyclase [Roseomonas terrae]|uniref:Sensor domain-containing diguanylate cyclase n=1 Tax=Neoroseomonas terrae TaxID=424799 RepID=A0ABS5EPZ0_9PROT|nr:sensor domain-containing diguanylate cyclase [Neoroseomonas terrae]MBR0653102.1 sensor domain-containing diguanylate cyclase [Neoroseomonas terrae]